MAKKRPAQTPALGKRPTVFVHSSWRTSSTWLWTCFRRAPSTLTYYEIFYEALTSIDREQITTIGPTGWQSGHLGGAPYFLEYLPLLAPQGGVRKYRDTMAFKSFIPSAGLGGDLSDGEAEYVEQLIDHAQRLDRQPVLTDTRTLGRLFALKKRFGGYHIFLHRNLLHQWASYSSLAYAGNPYFLQMIKDIIEHNQHDPFLKDLRRLHPLGPPDCRSENYFMAFLLLHLHLYMHAFAHASIALDVTRLARDLDYREQTQRKIRKRTGNDLDFETVRSNFEFCLSVPGSLPELREKLVAAMQSIQSIQKSGRAEIRQTTVLIDELIEEMDRHKFYTANLTSIVIRPGGLLDSRVQRDGLVGERDALAGQCESITQERNGLAIDRDAFRSERDTAVGQRDALAQERDGLAAERDAFRTERDILAGQRDALTQELNGLAAERDAFRTERDILAGQRDALTQELDGLATERDAFHTERDILAGQRDALMQESHVIVAERDILSEERDVLAIQREGLLQDHIGIAAERDILRNERDSLVIQRDVLTRERNGLAAERDALRSECDALRGMTELSSRQLVAVGDAQRAKSRGPRSIFFWKRLDS